MGKARASEVVTGPLDEVEALWYEPARWPSWLDGFGRVVSLGESWPAAGAVLDWDSKPGGRGRVRERVTAHEPGAGQALAVEDERLSGAQSVAFAEEEDGAVRVTLILEYTLKDQNPLMPVVDALFIRRSMSASLQRSLTRFARERAADFELR